MSARPVQQPRLLIGGLTGEWFIVTRYRIVGTALMAERKYPVPPEDRAAIEATIRRRDPADVA